jgi:nucleotide-binding universal stress UspA family protein
MQRIMIATDGSRSAKRALDAAAKLAKKLNSELIIITVGGNLSESDLKRLSRSKDTIANALKVVSGMILDEACKRAKSIGVPKITRQSETGDPAKAIIDAARRRQVDILVVGRHGFGPLTGWLFGSVSQKLTSLAPCTVMIVP